MAEMGCWPSAVSDDSSTPRIPNDGRPRPYTPGETVLQAFVRLEAAVTEAESSAPAARLAALMQDIEVVQEDLIKGEESQSLMTPNRDHQDEAIVQVILDLKIAENPQIASEHEEFVANINRQEINKFNRSLMEARFTEMMETKKGLERQVADLQYLYREQDVLLESVCGPSYGSLEERQLESAVGKARALRDTLAGAARGWRTAQARAAQAHSAAARALVAWQIIPHAQSVQEAVRLGVESREGVASGVWAVKAASTALPNVSFPYCTSRQLQAVTLTLEYMFTDMYSPQRYEHATRIFTGFSERTLSLATWITEVFKSSLDKDLEEVDANVNEISNSLRTTRVNIIANKGLTDVRYKTPDSLKAP